MENTVLNENAFLNVDTLNSFRKVINSSPIFSSHEKYKHRFNLICVFMDRIDSAIRYLNAHADLPKTEEDFITFLVFAAILRDGINKLYENIYHEKPPYVAEKKYFSNAMYYNKPYFTTDTCPTDDNFFEYLRAMAFAHPYEVSARGDTRPFITNGDIHYCPWVIIHSSLSAFQSMKDVVGIRVYSKKDEDSITDITISFSALKEYIKSRYSTVAELTDWAKNGISEQEEKWKQIRINRNQKSIDILREITLVLRERFSNTSTIETIIQFLECPLTVQQNYENTMKFREAIINDIPAVCDCVDNLDYDGIEQVLAHLFESPPIMHKMANYQLEKIFTYLDQRSDPIDPESNEYWGLLQAYEFSQEFAKKWVIIDVDHMSYDEIKLLVCVACFMENQEQKGIIS